MALNKNNGLRNEQVEFFGSIWDGGTLEIYAGAPPADPDDTPVGDLLATITIPATAFGAASAGVISKSGTWSDTADDTGVAGFARFISADTLKKMDVLVTEDPGDNDLLINELNITVGNTVTVVSLTFTTPENG